MAKSGDMLEHPVTGERIVWRKVARDTSGEHLEADLYVAPTGFVAAQHVHPGQEERFEVLAGKLRLRVDGTERVLEAGASHVVERGRPHVWWCAGDEELHVRVELRPALRTEMFFETFFGLARDGKTNRKGLPNLLQMAVVMREYDDEIRLARPPYLIQKALFTPLAIIGQLLRYRGWYPIYSAAPLARGPRPASKSEKQRSLG